ncbi:OmpA family protein [Sphingomonas sp. G124]|uniref:OmpA family protein n=1 Tax=Sphingomonas cremea TaxID=2904799 RepID=A0A9X1QJU2_9SPHN|nr:OmpA family protein [Sphingomonas cremea]MCF2514906.1 OmpA family protein [Sphingomonas cremea]
MRAGIALAGLLLGGCATSSLVLLPDDEGHQGSVAVLEVKGQPTDAVIADGNSRTALGNKSPTAKPLGNKGLKEQEAALLTGLPPPARSFTLYFELGTVTLTPQSTTVLNALRAEIAGRSGPEVEVIGHTDTVGSADDNDILSMRRAEEVLNWLASQGFDRSIMSAVGRGERELKEPSVDNFDSPINRRVEVIVR